MYHIVTGAKKLYFTAEDTVQSCKDLIAFCQGGSCIVWCCKESLRHMKMDKMLVTVFFGESNENIGSSATK